MTLHIRFPRAREHYIIYTPAKITKADGGIVETMVRRQQKGCKEFTLNQRTDERHTYVKINYKATRHDPLLGERVKIG